MAKDVAFIISAKDNATKVLGKISTGLYSIKTNAEKFQWVAGKIGAVSGVAFGSMSLAINGAVKDASNLESSLLGLQSIVKGTGNDFDKAKEVIRKFTADGLVSTGEAATSLKNLLAKGFSLDQAEQMMNRFKDAAAFGRQAALGLGEAVAGATEGIKNENSMLVDNAGVTKNVSVMVTEYAKALWIKETALTSAQKNEAIYQGIIKETQMQVGDATKATQTYAWQVALLDAQKLQLSQTIGTTLMPTMTSLYWIITPVVQTVMTWTRENPNLANTIIITTTVVTWLTAALSVLGLMIPSIITGFWAVVVWAKALWAALLFLTTNPIWLAITALTTLALAALYIYNNWETIRPKLAEVWTAIWGTVAYAVNGAKTAVFEAFDYIKTKVEAVTNWLAEKVQTVLSFAKEVKNAMSETNALNGGIWVMAADAIAGARATGWPVAGGSTYLVGERGPELFTPSRSGTIIPNGASAGGGSITVNMGGVTISNAADADYLVERVKKSLIREIQLAKKNLYA